MRGSINQILSKLRSFARARCVVCGRKATETALNLEGIIHHGCRVKCIDRRGCERYTRRKRHRDRKR